MGPNAPLMPGTRWRMGGSREETYSGAPNKQSFDDRQRLAIKREGDRGNQCDAKGNLQKP